VAQEFREALTSHSEARAPGCLFKKHRGGKVFKIFVIDVIYLPEYVIHPQN
jgi:hypothetical protein